MTALEFVKEQMNTLNINYDFEEWTQDEISKLYFIGNYYKEDEPSEDGSINSKLILTSHNTGCFKDFFGAIRKINEHFNLRKGIRTQTDSGYICVFFDGSKIIPPAKAGERTKAEIVLKIREKTDTQAAETE